MIQVAVAMIPELIKIVTKVVEDPETFKKLEGIRQLLCKLTGNEISRNGLADLLEVATQGEPYTGKWEDLPEETSTVAGAIGVKQVTTRRLRVEGGWLYDVGRGNVTYVPDK